jgi:hypothetical protein
MRPSANAQVEVVERDGLAERLAHGARFDSNAGAKKM